MAGCLEHQGRVVCYFPTESALRDFGGILSAAPELLSALVEVTQWAEMQSGYPQGTFEICRLALSQTMGVPE
jgi:hypothetical protein